MLGVHVVVLPVVGLALPVLMHRWVVVVMMVEVHVWVGHAMAGHYGWLWFLLLA